MSFGKRILDDMVHVPGFGRDDTGVLELDAMSRMAVVPRGVGGAP
jgi:hypothetical protein